MNREKYTLFAIFLVVGLIFLVTINLLTDADTETQEYVVDGTGIVSFYVQNASLGHSTRSGHTRAPYMIRWLEIDNIHYLMIPNSADINQLTIYFQASAPVFLGDIQLISGECTDLFANRDGEPVILTSDGYQYEVVIMESSEIATLFIQTESGHLDDIHESQSHREMAQLLMIDADGETILYNGEADRFNGRGNTTWTKSKRPYNFRLAESANLLGIGDANHRHWALLADFMDSTRLRNTISHSIAQEVGLEAAIRFRPVDVYINNEYMGLYLLTERVRTNTILPLTDLEAITRRVNERPLSEFEHVGNMEFEPGARRYFDIPFDPPDITGGYLLEWQLSSRYRSQPSGFVTDRGQAIVLRAPTHASSAQMAYIGTFIQEMEDAIYSPTGYNDLGRHFTEYIDMRSAAQMYVFQEFIINVDASITSFFFYKESDLISDGLLRAAPPWDFDLSLGFNMVRDGVDLSDPEVFYVNNWYRLRAPYEPHLLTALWQHEEFRELSMEIWREEFAPVVIGLIDSDTPTNTLMTVREYEEAIRDSIQMEWVRWEITSSHARSVNRVIDFIERRIHFLNEEWSN